MRCIKGLEALRIHSENGKYFCNWMQNLPPFTQYFKPLSCTGSLKYLQLYTKPAMQADCTIHTVRWNRAAFSWHLCLEKSQHITLDYKSVFLLFCSQDCAAANSTLPTAALVRRTCMAHVFTHTLFVSEIIYTLELLQHTHFKDSLIRIAQGLSYKKQVLSKHIKHDKNGL